MVGQSGDRRAGRYGGPQVGTPDVPTVDQAGDDGLATKWSGGGETVQVARAGDQVQADGVDRGVQQGRQRVAEVAEVCRHEDPRSVRELTEPGVGAAQGVDLGWAAVGGVGGLVQLHPADARVRQLGENPGVGLDQVVEPGERIDALGQQQERGRSDEHRPGGDAQAAGFGVLVQRLRRVGGEDGVRGDLRHQVVVVGVEPLRQFQRRLGVDTTCHGEVGVQRGQAQPAEPGRDRAHSDRRVEHLVVVGEGVRRDRVETGVAQRPPHLRPQPSGGAGQSLGVDGAGPVRLDGLLQFTVRADAWVAEHGALPECGTHQGFLPSKCPADTGGKTGTPRVPASALVLPRDRRRRTPAACAALAGLRTRGHDTRSPTGRRFPDLTVQCFVDGGRSHSPLRGSPGFAPGSLLRRPTHTGGTNQHHRPSYGPHRRLGPGCPACGTASRPRPG